MKKPREPKDMAAGRAAADQGRAAEALGAAGMGEFEWDLDSDLIFVSPRMSEITGVPGGEWPSQTGEFLLNFVHPEDRGALRAALTESLLRDARYSMRYRMVRPDDQRVLWMESSGSILRRPDESPNKLIGVVWDVSAHKIEEDEREALVSELDHRIKNVLASVQSLAAQSARKTASLDVFLRTFTGRLEAMAAAHTLLTRTRWRGAEIGDVVAAELSGLAHGRARWQGPALLLGPRATNALALALHELGANAVKFGALSIEAGRVEVRWRGLERGGFELVWTERRGPPVETPARQGFGLTLLERVTGRELGGEADVQFLAEGLRATITAGPAALVGRPPSSKQETQSPAQAEPESQAGASDGGAERAQISGLRVLVVEDAMLLALELEAALTEAGALVLGPAATVGEGVSLMEQAFDVALIDADLSGRSRRALIEALKVRGKPYILASGQKDVGGAPDEAGAPLVRKPYNMRQIAWALTQVTGRAGPA
jgi:two-component sensor histidine kinase/CheY-like chemotaxis protein